MRIILITVSLFAVIGGGIVTTTLISQPSKKTYTVQLFQNGQACKTWKASRRPCAAFGGTYICSFLDENGKEVSVTGDVVCSED